jgi:hypothetical protein
MTAHEFLDTFNVSFQALRLSTNVTCYGRMLLAANVHSGSTGPSGDERKDLQDLARLSLQREMSLWRNSWPDRFQGLVNDERRNEQNMRRIALVLAVRITSIAVSWA